MMAFETIAPNMKVNLRLPPKKIGVGYGTTKGEHGERVSRVDENRCCSPKRKFSVSGSVKRGPQGCTEGQKVKRQKMDRRVSLQCASILKSLTSHRYSWVFIKPVDPVALNIPDYFTVISRPMDLGTIKSKLERNVYFDIDGFAADVRLTFSNAMTYNPPGNDVHLMAKTLSGLFESKWKDIEKKSKCEGEHGKSMAETVRNTEKKICNATHLLQKDSFPKKSQAPELKGIQKISSLAGRHPKEEVPKLSQIPRKFAGKDLRKDKGDGRHPSSGSGKACPTLGLSTCKCSICGDTPCVCASDSDLTRISSEGSQGRDLHDDQAHRKLPLQRKARLDSYGEKTMSHDGAHTCSSFQLTKPATDAASGEVWSTPVIDVQMSPKKALHAAMQLRRYRDTILKAKQKMYLDHGYKSDSWKIQQEKERLEKMQRDEKARIDAQIKAAEVKAKQDKQRRDKKREAARIAIQNMDRTAKMENNLESLKELESLSGGKLYYPSLGSSPLKRLGFIMKDEYISLDEDEVLNDIEEGEILS